MTEFEQIYRAYFQDVELYLRAISHNESLAEELTEQVFFQALNALPKFRGNCDIRTWLCSMARNAYLSHLRKERPSQPIDELEISDPKQAVEEQIMDNTIILFVSDHGEMLGDHLMFQKAKPFQGSIRVPLFISGPERYVGKHGTVCTDLAELRDVMPTLLELAGAPIPETVDGTSLLHPVEREYLHGEHTLGEDSMHFILTKEDKYIWYSQTGRELYFNLRDDPHETKNVQEENQKRVAELRALLIDALKNREEGYTDGHTLLVGKTPVTVLQHTEVL